MLEDHLKTPLWLFDDPQKIKKEHFAMVGLMDIVTSWAPVGAKSIP